MINTKVTGITSTYAGLTKGFADGAKQTAKFNAPAALDATANGELYIADTGNHRIRKINKSGVVSTLIGTGVAGSVDGGGPKAMLNTPGGIALAKDGSLYISDTGNHTIRRLSVEYVPGGCTADAECDDGNLCVDSVCDMKTGKCGNINVADGGVCGGGKQCKAGACVAPSTSPCHKTDNDTCDKAIDVTKCLGVKMNGTLQGKQGYLKKIDGVWQPDAWYRLKSGSGAKYVITFKRDPADLDIVFQILDWKKTGQCPCPQTAAKCSGQIGGGSGGGKKHSSGLWTMGFNTDPGMTHYILVRAPKSQGKNFEMTFTKE